MIFIQGVEERAKLGEAFRADRGLGFRSRRKLKPCRNHELLPRQRRVAVRVDASESAANLLQRVAAEVLRQESLVLLHLLPPLLTSHLSVMIFIQGVEERAKLGEAFRADRGLGFRSRRKL